MHKDDKRVMWAGAMYYLIFVPIIVAAACILVGCGNKAHEFSGPTHKEHPAASSANSTCLPMSVILDCHLTETTGFKRCIEQHQQ